MANFQLFFPTLLAFEGGFVNDSADPGGATNKGITLQTFEKHAVNLLAIQPTLDNLKALTNDQAAKIYKPVYWDAVQGDAIDLQELANIGFDFYVNAGNHASKLLQQVLVDLGENITVDGQIGQGTLTALGNVDQNEVYRRYKQGRIAYYQDLVQAHPVLQKFLNGWLNRVNTFPDA